MNKLYNEVGRRIADLRSENHLTQAQLAEKMDVSVKHMSEVERGLTCFPLERLVQLCDLFSVDLDYLVRGIDHRAPAESNVPFLVIDLFKPDNEARRQLALEYFLMFKKIYGDR